MISLKNSREARDRQSFKNHLTRFIEIGKMLLDTNASVHIKDELRQELKRLEKLRDNYRIYIQLSGGGNN